MMELARRAPTKLQDVMDKAEEFINAKETIQTFIESRVHCRVPPVKNEAQQGEGGSRKEHKGAKRKGLAH